MQFRAARIVAFLLGMPTTSSGPFFWQRPWSSAMMHRLCFAGILTVAWLATAAQAQNNWPRFRGPNADGVAPDHAGLPTTWTTTDNVK